MEKQTIKEKMKKSLKVMGLVTCLAGSVGGAYLASTYLKPVREETSLLPECRIVEIYGGELSYAKFLTPSGKLSEAIISFRPGLERTISESLHKGQPILATIETKTKVYSSKWGHGPEKYYSERYVKSVEGER